MSDKSDALILALRDIDLDMGVYPAAIQGMGKEKDYKERDGYKNGWNAAVKEITDKQCEMIEQFAKEIDTNIVMLVASGEGYLASDGIFQINFNDTWGWALAWHEPVPKADLPEVARLYRKWGRPGLLYWCSEKHEKMESEFKDINRYVAFVRREEEWEKQQPDYNKRAYQEIPK